MKLKERERAIELRKQGWSLNELSKELKVSKSSVSLWVNSLVLSEEANHILRKKFTNGQIAAQEAHRKITKVKEGVADEFSKKLLSTFKPEKVNLLLLCSMIYLCEGNKAIRYATSFTNSDPLLLATFLKLFRASFSLDEGKFRACIHLHPYHNKAKQLEFWSRKLSIPKSQFIKPFIKKTKGVFRKEGYEGCVCVRYGDVAIARIIRSVARQFMENMLV